jgi:hypothetical protein
MYLFLPRKEILLNLSFLKTSVPKSVSPFVSNVMIIRTGSVVDVASSTKARQRNVTIVVNLFSSVLAVRVFQDPPVPPVHVVRDPRDPPVLKVPSDL